MYICENVKFLALILNLLSLLLGSKESSCNAETEFQSQFSVCENKSPDSCTDRAYNRESCISAIRGYSFAGSSPSGSFSVHGGSPEHRTTSHSRFNFRIFKCGKILDSNNSHPFLAHPAAQLSGARLPDRYLHSICRLRL